MERISSRENERVKHARKLATQGSYRTQTGQFFIEGRRLCLDLATTLRPQIAFFTEETLKTYPGAEHMADETYLINSPVADKLATTKTPQGLFCVFPTPQSTLADLAPAQGILVCEEVQDPANVGAMLRSAAAFGFGGVILTPGCADPFSPRALRASAGAAARLPILHNITMQDAADALKKQGVLLYAAALHEAKPLHQTPLHAPFALLVGNEGMGLSHVALAAADQTLYIPMHRDVESLNAAVAASVLMFHFSNYFLSGGTA